MSFELTETERQVYPISGVAPASTLAIPLFQRSRTQLLTVQYFSSSKFFHIHFAEMNCSIRPSKSVQGFYCPSVRFDTTPCIHFLHFRPNSPPTHFNLRLKNSVTLKLGQKLLPTCASKANPSEGSDGNNGKAAQGPPFLTILAGFLVFFVLCWIIGSILLRLIGLFVRASPSK